MAYQVSVYFNSEYIASTRIRNGSFINEIRYYGDDAYIASGFTGTTTFTATPADGCEFVKWYYRIGGDSGTLQESTDNPFSYSGTDEIIIRAVGQPISGGGGTGGGEGGDSGGDESSEWSRYVSRFDTVGEYDADQIYLNEMEMYMYFVSFANSGTAIFYTTGNVDTVGYLTTSTGWDSSTGIPTSSSIIATDDNSEDGDNFRIEWDVTAGTTYYIWIRGKSKTTTGLVAINIEGPLAWKHNSGGGATVPPNRQLGYLIEPYRMECYYCKFSQSGTATFYTTGTLNTIGYLGTSSYFNSGAGEPTSYLTKDDNSGDGDNFRIEWDVTAGTYYYIWVRCKDPRDAGSTVLNIEFAEESSITKWDWYSSNGTASANQTIAAYNAVANKQSTKNFSHYVWDDMVDKVKEICDEAVGWWDSASYGLSYANTKAIANSNGEYVLTADMFNSLRNNLEIAGYQKLGLSKIPTGTSSGQIPHPVNSGDTVFGHYFITLTNYMNSCIDKL